MANNEVVVIPSSVNEKMSDIDRARYYINQDLKSLASSFVKLGFHLREAFRSTWWKDAGYSTFYEWVESEFNISKSTANRYIGICETFSQNGHSMFLIDRFKDYSYSQLVEMLPMYSYDRDKIKPEMSIKQIREYKKCVAYRNSMYSNPNYLEQCPARSCPKVNRLNKPYKCCSGCGMSQDCSSKCNRLIPVDISLKKPKDDCCDVATDDNVIDAEYKEVVPASTTSSARLVLSWNVYTPGAAFMFKDDADYVVTMKQGKKNVLAIRKGSWMKEEDNADKIVAWFESLPVYEEVSDV